MLDGSGGRGSMRRGEGSSLGPGAVDVYPPFTERGPAAPERRLRPPGGATTFRRSAPRTSDRRGRPERRRRGRQVPGVGAAARGPVSEALAAADAPPEDSEPVVLALGSNLGDRLRHLADAVVALKAAVTVDAASSVYASDPVGYQDQGEFLNAVLVGRTERSPRSLLAACQAAEAAAGRVRERPDGPRTLDVDVVFFGRRVIRTPELVVPHPRWRERGFVMAPLAEVAPRWIDPETGRPVAELAAGARLAPGRPRRVAGPDELLRGGRTR